MLVAKFDRLRCDVHFIVGLITQRAAFVVAELGTDVDPFMPHIYAALTAAERRMISERNPAALAVWKGQGVRRLGNPANLTAVGTLGAAPTADAARRFAETVAPAIQQIRTGSIVSLRGIAAELNSRRVCSARGGRWITTQVTAVLARAETARVGSG